LSENVVYETISSVVKNCLENSLKPFVVGNNTQQFSVSIIEDVYKICKFKDFVLAAFSDLDEIFSMKKNKIISKTAKKNPQNSKEMMLARKKIKYYLSWANEMPPHIFEQLSCALEIEHKQLV